MCVIAVDAPLERQRGLRVWRLQAQACMLLSVMMCGDGVASAFAHGMEKLSPPAPLLMCDDHRPSRSACVGRRGCRESVPSQVDSCCVGRALLCFYPTGLLARCNSGGCRLLCLKGSATALMSCGCMSGLEGWCAPVS